MKKLLTKPLVLIAFILIFTVSVVARKIYVYSADPSGEKDCPPLFPTLAGDPAKPTAIDLKTPSIALPWSQKGGTINDASCLNKTYIYGLVQVKTIEDIKNALLFARENSLKVSLAGVKHSMGGHAFYQNALVLDMTHFNHMSLDEENKLLTVQSGASWHDIQNFLHPRFAVKAMQSTDIFTVGGSISVNAHGMDHQVGALGRTIRSMRVMLADGSIQRVSRIENPELFHLVVGGYGLFGVILDVELEVADNVIYEPERRIIHYQDFPEVFEQDIAANKDYGLFYGHLSTDAASFLQEMILYTYKTIPEVEAEIPPLTEVSNVKLRRLVLNLSKQGPMFMSLKWWAEKNIEPLLEACTISRNQAMKDGEACLVSRNNPMHDSVKYLRNDLSGETDILHEYFIPRRNFIAFIDRMRQILLDRQANVLNASVRVVHQEDIALNYAPADMFSIVLYINQSTDAAGNEQMRRVTGDLIDLTTELDGRFFLPYQLHYTGAQLERSYPEIRAFFAAKKQYDPDLILTNTFYEKYAQDFN
ncbi:MAG: FAD-binding oxidoreductase [Anaerolineae bacterium]|nr:FAD-binding oxidoreductase [Anaerolineae bacterium]